MSYRVRGERAVLLAAVSMVLLACSRPKPAESGAPQGLSGTPREPVAPPATSSTDTAPLPTVPVAPAAPAAASDTPAPQTLFVHEKRNDCQGEAPMKCLQVRESQDAPWRNFFGRIEGFEYEEGNAYELRVEVTPIPDPPADASNRRYRLVEIVSKRKGEGGAP